MIPERMLAATPLQRGVYAGRYDERKPLALRQAVAGCRRLWMLLAAVLASSDCRVAHSHTRSLVMIAEVDG